MSLKTELNNKVINKPILEIAETYFRERITPKANIIDRQSDALKEALQEMGKLSLLALRVPQNCGGAGISNVDFHRFQMLVARYSGSLAFLQTQHQSAAYQISLSSNKNLKEQYLPYLSQGKILIGVGFSQLRRQGEPVMKAIPVSGGYQLDGEVPWITGFGFFQHFIIGATLDNGNAVYGIMPFEEIDRNDRSKIEFSAPMELAAMSSTNTVSARLSNWFLEKDRVLSIVPPEAIALKDRDNVLHHGFFALGCAQAGLDILETASKRKKLTFIDRAFDSLQQEVDKCCQSMFAALSPESETFEARLQLRARSIDLANRCAQAAIVASSGRANSLEHPAQRVYREALMFSVFGQTTAVMEATLNQLLVC